MAIIYEFNRIVALYRMAARRGQEQDLRYRAVKATIWHGGWLLVTFGSVNIGFLYGALLSLLLSTYGAFLVLALVVLERRREREELNRPVRSRTMPPEPPDAA